MCSTAQGIFTGYMTLRSHILSRPLLAKLDSTKQSTLHLIFHFFWLIFSFWKTLVKSYNKSHLKTEKVALCKNVM